MPKLLLFISVLGLAGCGGWTGFVKSTEPCSKPVPLSMNSLNDRQVEILWSKDRQALLDCADKVETLSGRKVKPR